MMPKEHLHVVVHILVLFLFLLVPYIAEILLMLELNNNHSLSLLVVVPIIIISFMSMKRKQGEIIRFNLQQRGSTIVQWTPLIINVVSCCLDEYSPCYTCCRIVTLNLTIHSEICLNQILNKPESCKKKNSQRLWVLELTSYLDQYIRELYWPEHMFTGPKVNW